MIFTHIHEAHGCTGVLYTRERRSTRYVCADCRRRWVAMRMGQLSLYTADWLIGTCCCCSRSCTTIADVAAVASAAPLPSKRGPIPLFDTTPVAATGSAAGADDAARRATAVFAAGVAGPFLVAANGDPAAEVAERLAGGTSSGT